MIIKCGLKASSHASTQFFGGAWFQTVLGVLDAASAPLLAEKSGARAGHVEVRGVSGSTEPRAESLVLIQSHQGACTRMRTGSAVSA